MRVLAVDFGTSNTVAALGIDGGAPRLVTIDGSPLVPSSVFLTDDGTLAVGRDADRQARIDPSRYEPNPKRRIDDGSILLGDRALPVTTVIAEVLRRVAAEVHRQLGGGPEQVRLTHPARWGQRRKDSLVAAAREAGLADDPVLVPEPVAAATHFATLSGSGLSDNQALAVYDLGGGTFDIAVVQRRGDGYEVLAEAGLPDLGGLDFDHAIVEHIGATHARGADAVAWGRLLMPTDAASRRMARALSTDVRDGKEALSRYPHVDIALPPPFTDVHLTRTEFEELIRPNLARSIDLMRRTISEAGYQPARLAGVYLVGGSSRVPLVARLIQEGLGVTPTTLDQPETSVATGALYLGVGHARPAAAGPLAPATGQVPALRPGPTGPVRQVAPATGPQPVARFAPTAPTPPTAPLGPPSGAQHATSGPHSGSHPSPGPHSGAQAAVHPHAPARPAAAGVGSAAAFQRTAAAPGTPGHPGHPGTGPWTVETPAFSAPPPAPGGPGRLSQPGGSQRAGRILAVGGGLLATVLVAVLVAVLATRGGSSGAADGSGGGGGGGGGGGRVDPTASASTDFDDYFSDATLRNYVRPTYSRITSCNEGLVGEESFPGAATCTYSNGVQVEFGVAGDTLPLDQLRDLIGLTLVAGDLSQQKGTWSGGVRDVYTPQGEDRPAAIYWDRKQGGIFAAAQGPSDMSKNELLVWWADNFDR